MTASLESPNLSTRIAESGLRALSRLPLPIRRSLLRIGVPVFGLFGLHSITRDQVVNILVMLQLSPAAALAVAKRSQYHDALFLMEWLAMANRSMPGLLADARFVSTSQEDEAAFEWAAQQKSAMLTTLHMGPYSLTFAWLLHRYFHGRKIIVIKSRDDNEDEQRAMLRLSDLGVDVELLMPGRSDEFHRLLRAIRNGAMVLSLADLPDSYGKSTDAEFLWRGVSIAGGVSELAAICQIPIILFRTRTKGVHDLVEIDRIFEPARSENDQKAAVRAISSFVTQSLIAYPEQWHMWARFREYRPVLGAAACCRKATPKNLFTCNLRYCWRNLSSIMC